MKKTLLPGYSFTIFGFLIHVCFDINGFWITDKLGYANHQYLSLSRVTDLEGKKAFRFTCLWFSVAVAKI